MATVAASPTTEQGTAPAVCTCYELLEVMRICGMPDFTDGKYIDDRDDRAAYLAAQERQAEYLLDQAHCDSGTRLLDIGCGYGRILEQAARRRARAVGITISPPQVANCRARGLDVRELNYRNIFTEVGRTNLSVSSDFKTDTIVRPTISSWEHAFYAIIANGSLEHFVQPADAAAGRTDAIYEELFTICRRLLRGGGRLVTTAIHFREVAHFDPAKIARGPDSHPPSSDEYQFAMIARWFGGWYPEPGQLERCAADRFELVEQEDGTHDYHRTSEYWLRQCRRKFATDPRVWWAVAKQLWQRPRPALEMLRLQLRDESWAWQFRPPAPMRLWRHTWLAR